MYSSGLAAFHALLIHLRPNVIAIGQGYHGCHGVLSVYQKLTSCHIVDLHDPNSWSGPGWELGKGDLIHLETPLNPTGEAFDITHFAKLAREKGAFLSCDATFAPPPLLEPFRFGVDYVMHSGTKYIGGHSDMLCGVLAVNPAEREGRTRKDWVDAYNELWTERVYLGSVMGSLEGWLGIRSVRTLALRVERQSRNAEEIVEWLDALLKGKGGEKGEIVRAVVEKIQHASIQAKEEGNEWLKEQMPNGYGPVFAIVMKSAETAKRLPGHLDFFHHATSLGGVESLIEWRRMSDKTVDERLLRVSVGVEDAGDLKRDLFRAFRKLSTLR